MPICLVLNQAQTYRAMQIESLSYELDWQEFTVGSSFFIPCLDADKARERVQNKMDRLGYAVLIKLVIEDGVRGLRVWRIRRII